MYLHFVCTNCTILHVPLKNHALLFIHRSFILLHVVVYAVNGFGSGTGLILLDNADCSGNEMKLEDCQFAPIGENNCDHTEDAGVICMSSGILYNMYTCSIDCAIVHCCH